MSLWRNITVKGHFYYVVGTHKTCFETKICPEMTDFGHLSSVVVHYGVR